LAPAWKTYGARLIEPGALYNFGNVLGFGAGLAVAMTYTPPAGGDLALGSRLLAFLAGSLPALAMTAATLVFFWAGLVYSRAWADGPPPDPQLNRQGDFLSGIGALFLAAALFMLGDPVLAATTGFLHALGKFGSALGGGAGPVAGGLDLGDLGKDLVLLSRVPAVLTAITAFRGDLLTTTFLVCCLVWAAADILLLSPRSLFRAGYARVWPRRERKTP